MRSSAASPGYSRSSRALQNAGLVVLTLAAATVVFALLYFFLNHALERWTARDLDHRAELIFQVVSPDLGEKPTGHIAQQFDSIASDRHVVGVLGCWASEGAIATDDLPPSISCESPLVRAAFSAGGRAVHGTIAGAEVQLNARRSGNAGVVVVQERSFLAERRQRILKGVVGGGELALLILFFVSRASSRAGRTRAGEEARDLFRRIGAGEVPAELVPRELQHLAADFRNTLLVQSDSDGEPVRGVSRLRRLAATELGGSPLVVVANREPYSHEWSDRGVEIVQPPSGLVTGIEPLLRACGGVWIAHGSGSADAAHCDSNGRVAVPPGEAEYTLRRLFFEGEEYDRYYFGFANEGLWPLCHIAHTRPTFRADDWEAYESINAKFAAAAIEEGGADGLLLIQDYHFALAPRMIREANPRAVSSLFWHIPWPNWEVIGICPWKEALLDGMLGADVVGFHTRYYCLNFLETLQRTIECRVDFDSMSVEYRGHKTLVRPYPISVEWPHPSAPRSAGLELRRSLGIDSDVHVMVGVDRADYTKGLLERVAAVEHLLETNRDLLGKFVLVQLAAPSRTKIRRYRDLAQELREAVEQVNRRFGTLEWKPVILSFRSFSPEEVRAHYAMASSALVTPLHDGMNLVSKEYVASCNDLDGVLVLSSFAGAARELEGALLVNPYDAGNVAAAISRAVRMPEVERHARMRLMREQIAKHSIYDWSAELLRDLIDVRRRRDSFWPRRTQQHATYVHEEAG